MIRTSLKADIRIIQQPQHNCNSISFQEFSGLCLHCNRETRIPLPDNIMDYRSAYKEIEKHIQESMAYASETDVQNAKLLKEIVEKSTEIVFLKMRIKNLEEKN